MVLAASTYDVALYDVATYDAPPGTALVELLINGSWVNVTAYVRVSQGIRIQRGRQDEQAQPQAATCTLTLDNADGRFSPRYTSGAYYPYLKRNTQLRVSVYLDDGSTTIRFWGAVPSWPVDFDLTGRDVQATVVAYGPRRLLSIGAVPLASPYTLFVKGLSNVLGYWPMEDGDAATVFASGLDRGLNALQSGASFAADDTFVASSALPTFTAGASFRAVFPSSTPSVSGQQVRWLWRVAGTTAGSWAIQIDTNGSHFFWVTLAPATNAAQVLMFNYATAALEGTGTGTTLTGSLTVGMRMSFEAVQSGADIVTSFRHIVPGDSNAYFQTDTFVASTLGSITGVRMFWANQLPDGTALPGTPDAATLGQVTFENNITSVYDSGAVLTGYAGETALDRWTRICNSQGIPAVIFGSTSATLGPQGELTPLEILDDAVYADGGLSTELVTAYGLKYRARTHMYTTLVPSPQIGLSKLNEVTPIDDDQALVNDVTVTRPGGSSARAVATSGLTPASVGTYAASYTINVWGDSQLPDQAGWRMNVGAVDKPRWQFSMDATQLTSLLRTAVVNMLEGDIAGLTSVPVAFGGTNGGDVIRILGWTETITVTSWDFTVNAGPGAPWSEVFILDNSTFGILDTDRLGL